MHFHICCQLSEDFITIIMQIMAILIILITLAIYLNDLTKHGTDRTSQISLDLISTNRLANYVSLILVLGSERKSRGVLKSLGISSWRQTFCCYWHKVNRCILLEVIYWGLA